MKVNSKSVIPSTFVTDCARTVAGDIDAVDKQFPTQFTTFEVRSGSINTSKSALIKLPIGIEVNGSTQAQVRQAWQAPPLLKEFS